MEDKMVRVMVKNEWMGNVWGELPQSELIKALGLQIIDEAIFEAIKKVKLNLSIPEQEEKQNKLLCCGCNKELPDRFKVECLCDECVKIHFRQEEKQEEQVPEIPSRVLPHHASDRHNISELCLAVNKIITSICWLTKKVDRLLLIIQRK